MPVGEPTAMLAIFMRAPYLASISPISPLYLPYISPIFALYLSYTAMLAVFMQAHATTHPTLALTLPLTLTLTFTLTSI